MWIQPKTNWKISDHFNTEDYDRVRGNILFLYSDIGLSNIPVIPEPNKALFYSPEKINVLEKAINDIATRFFRPPNFPVSKTWYDNQKTPLWSDMNRIENSILQLYEWNHRIISGPKIPFKLGEINFG